MTTIDIMEVSERYDARLLSINLHQHLAAPSTPGLFKLVFDISVMDKLGYTNGFNVLQPYSVMGLTTQAAAFDVGHDILIGDWFATGATVFEPGVYRITATLTEQTPVDAKNPVIYYQGTSEFYIHGLLPQLAGKAVVDLRRLTLRYGEEVRSQCEEMIESIMISNFGIIAAASTKRYEDLVSNIEAMKKVIQASNAYVSSR